MRISIALLLEPIIESELSRLISYLVDQEEELVCALVVVVRLRLGTFVLLNGGGRSNRGLTGRGHCRGRCDQLGGCCLHNGTTLEATRCTRG